MKLPFYLNPASVFVVLKQLDQASPSFSRPREEGSQRALIVLFSVCVCLLLLNYGKNSYALEGLLKTVALWQNLPAGTYVSFLTQNEWGLLCRYAWWSSWTVITYVVIPCFIIKLCLRERIADYGWRWGDTHKHWLGYAYLLLPVLGFVVIASFREDFVDHYPFYQLSGRSWLDFVLWEALYLLQFASLEFFFRGYMLNSLRPYFGSAAIWIMIVPYLMIHFPKPWLEATGAIFFGLFLGILALRSRSIWGGFLVHAGVAVSMDIASLIQQGRLPGTLMP